LFDIPVRSAAEAIRSALGACDHAYQEELHVEASAKKGDPLASKAHYKGRLVLWIMEECLTGRVKLYQCSEWKSPRERRKRYSRQGFQPVAAFTYVDGVSLAINQRTDSIREATLKHFGTAAGKAMHGWLGEKVGGSDVITRLEDVDDRFLSQIEDIRTEAGRPCGVRRSYTGSGSQIDPQEIESCFAEVWWR